jgi:hypothetical protein
MTVNRSAAFSAPLGGLDDWARASHVVLPVRSLLFGHIAYSKRAVGEVVLVCQTDLPPIGESLNATR